MSEPVHHPVVLMHGQAWANRYVLAPFDDAETGTTAMGTGEVEQMVEAYVAAAVRARHLH